MLIVSSIQATIKCHYSLNPHPDPLHLLFLPELDSREWLWAFDRVLMGIFEECAADLTILSMRAKLRRLICTYSPSHPSLPQTHPLLFFSWLQITASQTQRGIMGGGGSVYLLITIITLHLAHLSLLPPPAFSLPNVLVTSTEITMIIDGSRRLDFSPIVSSLVMMLVYLFSQVKPSNLTKISDCECL